MKNHWDKNLNVKNIVEWHKPKMVLELGAGGGDNTDQYLELQKKMNYKFMAISDGEMPERYLGKMIIWIYGVSYLKIPRLNDKIVDFCSIDTDHNYWTLREEFKVLESKMKKGGIVVAHDTESYGNKSGMMQAYNCGKPYPYEEIKKYENKGLMDAINEQIEDKNYKILKQTKESAGAIALVKL